jgi:biopolymer transport protein ExbD
MKYKSILPEDELITQINVTPLVDVTLVLLIIFMVTATLVIAPSLNVDLPAVSKGTETPPSPIFVMITEDNMLYLNGNLISESEFKNEVTTLIEDQKDLRAILAADKNASHGEFIHILDILQALGIDNFSIQIQVSQ